MFYISMAGGHSNGVNSRRETREASCGRKVHYQAVPELFCLGWAIQQHGESSNAVAKYGNMFQRYGEVSNLPSKYGQTYSRLCTFSSPSVVLVSLDSS
jgi:hypothetical protein